MSAAGAFDTLKFVEKLEATGVLHAQAEAFAEATSQELATKAGLALLRGPRRSGARGDQSRDRQMAVRDDRLSDARHSQRRSGAHEIHQSSTRAVTASSNSRRVASTARN